MINKKITLTDVKTFLEASKADLEEQQKEFQEKYTDLIAAVNAAEKFLQSHPGKKDKIAVTDKTDSKPEAMWEKDLPKNAQSVYLFDTSLNPDDPKSLGEYTKRRDQYRIRLQDIDKAIEIAEKLRKKSFYLKDPVELMPIMRILALHEDYLEDQILNPESEKKDVNKQLSVLEQFMELIKQEENRKTKVRRFFSNVKNKLKRKKD